MIRCRAKAWPSPAASPMNATDGALLNSTRRQNLPTQTFHHTTPTQLISIDRNLDNDARLDTNRSNLLDNIRTTPQIDQPLMNPHLKAIPRIGALSTRRLARRNLERLSGHTHRSLDSEILILGAANKVGADFLQRLDVARGERDADALLLDRVLKAGLFDGGHCVVCGRVGGRDGGGVCTGDLRGCRSGDQH